MRKRDLPTSPWKRFRLLDLFRQRDTERRARQLHLDRVWDDMPRLPWA